MLPTVQIVATELFLFLNVSLQKKKKLFLFLDLYVLSYPGSISLIGQATPDQESIYPIQESPDHKSLLWCNQHLSLWT